MKKALAAAIILSLLPAAAQANPYSDLAKVSKALASAKSFQAVESHGSIKTTVTYVSPDRWQIDHGTIEQIVIGDDMYIRILGHWRRVPGAIKGNAMTAMIKNPLGGAPVSSTIKVFSETSGMLNGVPVRIFRYARHDTPGVKATLSVNARNNLPLKDVVVAPSSTTVVTYSHYNAHFTIVPH